MCSSIDEGGLCAWGRTEEEVGFLTIGPDRTRTFSSKSICGRTDMKEALKSLVGESSCGGWLDNGEAGKRDVGDDTLVSVASTSEVGLDGWERILSTSQRLSSFLPCLGFVGS